MLKRLYVDNFRCLVNFEIKFDRMNLLLGENGSGKSTVFEVIYRLKQFILGEATIRELFPVEDFTRWNEGRRQRFELDLKQRQREFNYVLEIVVNRAGVHIARESLASNGKVRASLHGSSKGKYFDDHAQSFQNVVADTTKHSFISTIHGINRHHYLNVFCKWMKDIIVADIDPIQMETESAAKALNPARNMSNFVSWYRSLSDDNRNPATRDLFKELAIAIPGFESFELKDSGEKKKALKVILRTGKSSGAARSYGFGELSHGQRVLIVLYTLLFASRRNWCLFLDEPDNFLALREIQPWLFDLIDKCGGKIEQAVLISHHPEIIDTLAASKGKWFDRTDNGPVHVRDMHENGSGNGRIALNPKRNANGLEKAGLGLKQSELVARGWV